MFTALLTTVAAALAADLPDGYCEGIVFDHAEKKELKIGDTFPGWSGLEGVDGKKHSFDELENKEVVVVAITCNHCPIATAYEDRIIDFIKRKAGPGDPVAFVAINVNDIEPDRLPRMKERAAELKKRAKDDRFEYLYLFDPSQETAHLLGAKYTPEFFVLDRQRRLVYAGAMDDNNDPAKARVKYLELAVEAARRGEKPETTQTRPRGSTIKEKPPEK